MNMQGKNWKVHENMYQVCLQEPTPCNKPTETHAPQPLTSHPDYPYYPLLKSHLNRNHPYSFAPGDGINMFDGTHQDIDWITAAQGTIWLCCTYPRHRTSGQCHSTTGHAASPAWEWMKHFQSKAIMATLCHPRETEYFLQVSTEWKTILT